MQEFFFTFGETQRNAGKYVRIEAETEIMAKAKMLQGFGAFYARCLDKQEFCNQPKSLVEIPFVKKNKKNIDLTAHSIYGCF